MSKPAPAGPFQQFEPCGPKARGILLVCEASDE
jgi:hypothetical protein